MNIGKTLNETTREGWRKWLTQNHDRVKEIWLVYYKKHSGKTTIPYEDAVEEAICFGWIDGIEKRIDEEKYAQRFTPRRKNSNWSQSNINRARQLIKEGKMTESGIAALQDAKRKIYGKSKN